ncbi:MAG: hypothetical protein LUD00_00895 [Prevotellaceae bacterium]|nr:hypothetical protein [Prevotellaceae bacterium]
MPEDIIESTETEVEETLRAVLQFCVSVSDTILDDAMAETFEKAGVMTMNRGLVVRLKDGCEYQLTIVQSR